MNAPAFYGSRAAAARQAHRGHQPRPAAPATAGGLDGGSSPTATPVLRITRRPAAPTSPSWAWRPPRRGNGYWLVATTAGSSAAAMPASTARHIHRPQQADRLHDEQLRRGAGGSLRPPTAHLQHGDTEALRLGRLAAPERGLVNEPELASTRCCAVAKSAHTASTDPAPWAGGHGPCPRSRRREPRGTTPPSTVRCPGR